MQEFLLILFTKNLAEHYFVAITLVKLQTKRET